MRASKIFFFFSFVFLSCSPDSPNTLAEYKAWFNDVDHGYVKTQTIEGLMYTLQFRTAEQMSIEDFRENEVYSEEEFNKIVEAYGRGNYYFLMEIKADTSGRFRSSFKTQEDKAYAIHQLTFQLADFCQLSVNDKLYFPTIYHLEKEYEITQKYSLIIGFQPDEVSTEFTFIFNDEIFNGGRLKFHFNPRPAPVLPLKLKV